MATDCNLVALCSKLIQLIENCDFYHPSFLYLTYIPLCKHFKGLFTFRTVTCFCHMTVHTQEVREQGVLYECSTRSYTEKGKLVELTGSYWIVG